MREKGFAAQGQGGYVKKFYAGEMRPAPPVICAKHEKFQFFGNGLIAKSLNWR
jgi:hypothetical protein